MTDKQRADHVQANYWNGYISRTEAQKVFDELGQAVMRQAVTLQKMDAVVSCIAEKVGLSAEDVNNWVKAKMEEAQKSSLDKAVEKAEEVPSLVII